MAMNMRRGLGFAAGLLLGAAGAAALFEFGFRGGQPSSAPAASVARKAAPAQPDTRVAGAGPAATTVAAAVSSVDCAATAFSPIVAPTGPDDGKVSLQQGLSAPVVLSMITSGKELAASGRARDAEATFLMACRGAQAVKPADPLLVADAQYQLGRHYAALAQQPDAQRRGDLLDRAARLYGASLQVYRARHGADNERTRYAATGLAAVQQQLAGMGRPLPAEPPAAVARAPQAAQPAAPAPVPQLQAKAAPAPVPAPAPAKPAPQAQAETKPVPPPPPQVQQQAKAPPKQPAPQPQAAPEPARPQVAQAPQPPVVKAPPPEPKPQAPAVVQAPPTPKPQAPVQARVQPPQQSAPPATVARAQPSFDCAKAHSAAERTICSDAELARADRELGRLHARAKAASADPRAFQRRSDAIWRDREANCTSRECLRQWYAQRRAELQTAQVGAGPAVQQPPRVQQRPVRPRPVVIDGGPAEASGQPYTTTSD
ncbi:MAG: hypothetical protein V4864_24280 [Pseudomonadota bacterium]